MVTVEETTDPASPSLRGLVSDVVSPSSSGWTYGKIGWWMRYRWFFRFLVWQTCTPCSFCQHVSQKKTRHTSQNSFGFCCIISMYFSGYPQKMGPHRCRLAARSLASTEAELLGVGVGWVADLWCTKMARSDEWWLGGGWEILGGLGCSWMVWTGNCHGFVVENQKRPEIWCCWI